MIEVTYGQILIWGLVGLMILNVIFLLVSLIRDREKDDLEDQLVKLFICCTIMLLITVFLGGCFDEIDRYYNDKFKVEHKLEWIDKNKPNVQELTEIVAEIERLDKTAAFYGLEEVRR